jgi:hypothetical protein
MKFKTVDVTVSRNVFDHCYGIAMGGVSSPHVDSYEASGLIVEQNTFIDGQFLFVDVYSCLNCIVRNNNIYGSDYGIRLSGIATQGESGCHSGAGGCDPTLNFLAQGNVIRTLHGSSGNPRNIFWVVDATELVGLASTDNTYCLDPSDATPRFAYDSIYDNLAAWQGHVSTDTLSRVNSAGVGQCGAHMRMSRIR